MNLYTEKLKNLMMSWRYDFHENPEIGFNETQTAKKIASLLSDFGLEVHTGIGKTGVVGILIRNTSMESIAIRADMDALPIQEKSTLTYRSKYKNTMHACGHDGHMAILLGAAKYLSEDITFEGNVIFIFQPNEENGLGAKAMIKDGLFDKFQITEIYALHNLPGLDIGKFATREGTITASESLFEIAIISESCHSALPHMSIDPIVVASEIILAIQTILSRKIDPRKNAVFSITEIYTDGKRNILPSTVTIKGDTRALDSNIKNIIEKKLRELVKGICLAHGALSKIKYATVFPITHNSKLPTNKITACVLDMYGSDNMDANCEPMLFSEDFSFFAIKKPGCFLLMGNGLTGACAEPLHSPIYDFNDQSLVLGSSMWVHLAKAIA